MEEDGRTGDGIDGGVSGSGEEKGNGGGARLGSDDSARLGWAKSNTNLSRAVLAKIYCSAHLLLRVF
jgi:hypothetical protein